VAAREQGESRPPAGEMGTVVVILMLTRDFVRWPVWAAGSQVGPTKVAMPGAMQAA
jgi:hypothetical protein